MSDERIDFDGAWKEAIHDFLQPFIEMCFPPIGDDIDWAEPPEFLETELQEVVRDADLGKQRVDKLVRVRRRNGDEQWVLIHIEVQSQPDPDLPQRLYQYHHCIADRFGRRVATLVVLADPSPGWRPQVFEEELWGCRVRFDFVICKLLSAGRVESVAACGVAHALRRKRNRSTGKN